MPIEMKIYKEIRGYEAKAMFGFTWRQLAALAVMIFVGGAVFAGTTLVLLGAGQPLEQATNVAMYLLFPILIPAAAWGWWRPQGLKPEQYLGFFLRYHLMKRHIRYEDTYRTVDAEHQSVPGGDPDESAKRARRRREAAIRRLRKEVTEHPEAGQGRGRSQARARRAAGVDNAGPTGYKAAPKRTRDVLGFEAMLPSGVAWLGEDEWSVTVRLSDINYVAASEGQQSRSSTAGRGTSTRSDTARGCRRPSSTASSTTRTSPNSFRSRSRATLSTSTAMTSTASSARNSRQRREHGNREVPHDHRPGDGR
jgi:hypothetical protein